MQLMQYMGLVAAQLEQAGSQTAGATMLLGMATENWPVETLKLVQAVAVHCRQLLKGQVMQTPFMT